MLNTRNLLARSLHLTTRLSLAARRQPTLQQQNNRSVYVASFSPSTAKSHASTGKLLRQRSNSAQQPQLAAHLIAKAAPDHNSKALRVTWTTGIEDRYNFLWLRDNCQCPACFHPTAKNRQLSTGALRLDTSPTVTQVSKGGQEVEVQWSDGHVSCFPAVWLQDRAFKTSQQEKQSNIMRLKMEFWGSEKQGRLRRFSFPLLRSDDRALLAFLKVLEVDGTAIIIDVPCQEGQFRQFTDERIGYVRPTHYGETFVVRSKKTASNVAYTTGALDMHNDMVYLEEKPGLQIMHCISQTKGQGGDHLMVDSFHVANQMRERHPEMFHTLTNTAISFIDVGFDSVGHFFAAARHPVIQCDEEGNVTGTNISNHSRDSNFNIASEDITTWYKAYLAFWNLLNDPKNYIVNKLQDGEMVVIDNYRVLHGRLAYQDSEGERHMESGYWDWDTVKSRRRVLETLLSQS